MHENPPYLSPYQIDNALVVTCRQSINRTLARKIPHDRFDVADAISEVCERWSASTHKYFDNCGRIDRPLTLGKAQGPAIVHVRVSNDGSIGVCATGIGCTVTRSSIVHFRPLISDGADKIVEPTNTDRSVRAL